MPIDLVALFSLEPRDLYALDWFVGSCLCEGGLWDSPRRSDGINVSRVHERAPERLRLWGHIYEIEHQTLHAYWLELVRDSAEHVAWSLYFDVAEGSRRRDENALSTYDRPEDIRWRAKLAGEAMVRDSVLTIVPGSTRIAANAPD